MAKLEYLHYHPDASVSGTVTLNGQSVDIQAAIASLNGQAQATAAQKNGIPADASFTFQASSGLYDAKLYGAFSDNQDAALQAFSQSNPVKADGTPWSASDLALLGQVLSDPKTSAPDFITAQAATISQAAIIQTKTQFHLEGTDWSPVAPLLSVNPQVKALFSETDSILNTATKYANGMPEGPKKSALLNILMRISIAISQLKQAIEEAMGGDSTQSRELSQAKLDIALASIKEQMDGAKDIAGKQQKAGDLGNGVNIINAITSLFMVVANIFNPIGFALAICSFVDTVDPNAHLIDNMMKDIGNLADKLLPAGASDAQKQAAAIAAKTAFMVAIAMVAGPGIVVIAATTGPKLLEASHIVRDVSLMAGASRR